ncbi:NAD-P-binding protein [Rhodocollybia butyracea]|uniref:NAD-P-binding protein n=1 Tax=Rhodocollybia butyracea TaxID=206335 RepID=A0A9P5PQN0_9AGAR|nr:NAD-P-binding protein [Rhodocollybia butyracea]
MSSALSTSLTGKVAVVTGGSRGIGAAIAFRLAEEGAKVVVNYLSNAQAADDVVRRIKSSGKGDAVAIQADASTISDSQALIDATIKNFGKLDILILNAGVVHDAALAAIDEDGFNRQINLGMKGPLFMTQAAVKHLPSGGRIIFAGSSATSFTGLGAPYLLHVMTKGAIQQMVRILAKDLGAQGITVNAVAPGPTDTDFFNDFAKDKPQIYTDMVCSMNPNNRFGHAEDIAPMVAFIASPAAQWVNGQNLGVNGGFVV